MIKIIDCSLYFLNTCVEVQSVPVRWRMLKLKANTCYVRRSNCYLCGKSLCGKIGDGAGDATSFAACLRTLAQMNAPEVVQLTDEQRTQVFEPLKRAYSDFVWFPRIAQKVKRAIVDCEGRSVNRMTTKRIAETYLHRPDFDTPDNPGLWKKIQLVFKSAYALILFHRELDNQRFEPKSHPAEETVWVSRDIFLAQYHEFHALDTHEQNLLFNFRNMAKIAMLFIDPKFAKQTILDIAGRLEGSQCAYITGSGQRIEVTRRVAIYEREAGVKSVLKPEQLLILTQKKKAGKKGPRKGTKSSKPTKRVRFSPGHSVVPTKRPRKETVPLVLPASLQPPPQPLPPHTLPVYPSPYLSSHTYADPALVMAHFPSDWSTAAAYVAQWPAVQVVKHEQTEPPHPIFS